MAKSSKTSLLKRIKKWNRDLRFLRIKLVLLITLPIAIISIGDAVIKEYTRIKLREAAVSSPETQSTQSPQYSSVSLPSPDGSQPKTG